MYSEVPQLIDHTIQVIDRMFMNRFKFPRNGFRMFKAVTHAGSSGSSFTCSAATTEGILMFNVHSVDGHIHKFPMAYKPGRVTGEPRPRLHEPVTRAAFQQVFERVQVAVESVSEQAVMHLLERFPPRDLTAASAVVQPCYWKSFAMQPGDESPGGFNEHVHVNVRCTRFSVAQQRGKGNSKRLVPPLLDPEQLKKQTAAYIGMYPELCKTAQMSLCPSCGARCTCET